MIESVSKIANAGATSGSPAWVNYGRVVAADASRATCVLTASEASGLLRGKNFQLGIPSNSTILGIVAHIKCQCSTSATAMMDVTIQLTDETGALVGDNKADLVNPWPMDDTVEGAIRTYGAEDDLWGATWTPTTVNDNQFSVAIAVQNTSGSQRSAGVDAIWVTIYYQEGEEALSDVPLVWMVGGGIDGFQPEADEATYLVFKQTIADTLAVNDYIYRVMVGAHWRNIEPAEGEFDWDRLDGVLEEIIDAGVNFKISLTPGMYCPQWLLDTPGIQLFETIVQNPNRDNYGESVYIPIPWDAIYQEKWFAAITALAEHLDSQGYLSSCYAVNCCPWSFQSSELHLPRQPDDLVAWAALHAASYLPDVMAAALTHYAAAFPGKRLCLQSPFGILKDDALTENIVQAALSGHANVLDIQSNALHGKWSLRGASRYVNMRRWQSTYPAIRLGAQTLASLVLPVDKAGQQQGTMRLTVQNVRDCECDAYLEVWHGNGKNLNICEALTALFAGEEYIGGDEDEDLEGEDDGGWEDDLEASSIDELYAPLRAGGRAGAACQGQRALSYYRAGVQRAGDPLFLGATSWIYAWRLNAPLKSIWLFRAGAGRAGNRLRLISNTVLECVVSREKPAHTILRFGYFIPESMIDRFEVGQDAVGSPLVRYLI